MPTVGASGATRVQAGRRTAGMARSEGEGDAAGAGFGATPWERRNIDRGRKTGSEGRDVVATATLCEQPTHPSLSH